MQLVKFIKETRGELGKVTWPTRNEVVQMTTLVIIISIAVGAYIGLLDTMFSKLLETVIR